MSDQDENDESMTDPEKVELKYASEELSRYLHENFKPGAVVNVHYKGETNGQIRANVSVDGELR